MEMCTEYNNNIWYFLPLDMEFMQKFGFTKSHFMYAFKNMQISYRRACLIHCVFFLKIMCRYDRELKKKHKLAAASSFPELDRIVQKIVNGKSIFSDLVISPLMYIQLQPSRPMYFSHLNEGPILFWSYQAHSIGESRLSQSSSDTHNK